MALEDLDAARNEISTLKKNLNVDDFLNNLKDQANISREKRKALMEKLEEKEDQIMEYQDKADEVNKLERENVALKNEMKSIVMRLTKEFEDRNKNEENLV